MQRWAKFRHIPPAPCEAQNTDRTFCPRERQRLRVVLRQPSSGEGHARSCQIGLMRVAPRVYNWAPAVIDTCSGLGLHTWW